MWDWWWKVTPTPRIMTLSHPRSHNPSQSLLPLLTPPGPGSCFSQLTINLHPSKADTSQRARAKLPPAPVKIEFLQSPYSRIPISKHGPRVSKYLECPVPTCFALDIHECL